MFSPCSFYFFTMSDCVAQQKKVEKQRIVTKRPRYACVCGGGVQGSSSEPFPLRGPRAIVVACVRVRGVASLAPGPALGQPTVLDGVPVPGLESKPKDAVEQRRETSGGSFLEKIDGSARSSVRAEEAAQEFAGLTHSRGGQGGPNVLSPGSTQEGTHHNQHRNKHRRLHLSFFLSKPPVPAPAAVVVVAKFLSSFSPC